MKRVVEFFKDLVSLLILQIVMLALVYSGVQLLSKFSAGGF